MNDPSELLPFDPIGLTRQLCEIESTTYNEGAVGDFLGDFLARRGWEVEKTPVAQPADSMSAGPRWNVYGGRAGETPDLVFSTHMDTVPPYIPYSEDAEFMHGRGVSDAKGIIAAQVAAAEALRAEGFRIGLLFMSGEERDSAGAKAANLAPKGSRYLINGEPTDNRVALASKGALRVVFRATGKMAHSAYPELGESAVHKLVQVMAKLLKLKLPVTEDIGPSTLNIGQIHGGHAPNVIADKAEAQVLVRLVGDSAPVKAASAGGGKGIGGSGLHAGNPVCAAPRAGGFADHGGEVYDRHSATEQLGRAVAAGSRKHPCGAYALREAGEERASGGGANVRHGGEAAACVAGLRRSPRAIILWPVDWPAAALLVDRRAIAW